jgi:hypothetical protein
LLCITVSQATISSSCASSYPSKSELLSCLPPELLQLNPRKAWLSLGSSLLLSLRAY